jgi:uncharacterized protein (TIGR03066 family)
MGAVCLLILAGLPGTFADDPKPKDAIVGKWICTEGETKDALVEFTKDGVVKVSLKLGDQDLKFEGKYKFLDDDNIEVEITAGGETHKEKNKVKISKDDMTLTDPKGKEEKFKRKK